MKEGEKMRTREHQVKTRLNDKEYDEFQKNVQKAVGEIKLIIYGNND